MDPWIFRGEPVTWRNYEASYDVAELEPASRESASYVLQEYFVPVERFDEFITACRALPEDCGCVEKFIAKLSVTIKSPLTLKIP